MLATTPGVRRSRRVRPPGKSRVDGDAPETAGETPALPKPTEPVAPASRRLSRGRPARVIAPPGGSV